MDAELCQLEKSLNASRSHAKRLQKASDVHAMYQSVKRDPPVQVDSLVVTRQVEVVEVDADDSAVVLARPVAWQPDAPVLHGSTPLSVIHFEEDKLWLESCGSIAVGDVLTQSKQIGKLEDLFLAFESQWSALWNRHADVPASQWDQIVNFAKANLKPVAPSKPTFSVGSNPQNNPKARVNMQQLVWMVSAVPTFCSYQTLTLPRSAWCINSPSLRALGLSRCCKGTSGHWPRLKIRVRWAISAPLLFSVQFTGHGLQSQRDIG